VQNPTRKSLGPLIATYRYHPLRSQESLSYLGLGILAVTIPLAYGLDRYRYGYNNYGELAAITWSRPWFLLAGFALISFCLLLVHRLRLAGRYIALHQRGLCLALTQTQVYRWEQISGIATAMFQPQLFGIKLSTRYRVTIFPNLGRPVHINDSFENVPECMTRLKASLYPRLTPQLKSEFLVGKWVYFGPIAIQRNNLRIRKLQVPWSKVKRVSVAAGDLVVELVDLSNQRLPVDQIPNFEILLQLIDQGVTA